MIYATPKTCFLAHRVPLDIAVSRTQVVWKSESRSDFQDVAVLYSHFEIPYGQFTYCLDVWICLLRLDQPGLGRHGGLESIPALSNICQRHAWWRP